MSEAYRQAGVHLEEGYEAVNRMTSHVHRTKRKGVFGSLGGFGGLFDLSALDYKAPVLVSGTDGVGTKLKIAFMAHQHDTIGIDAVAMCVNDVVAQGAEPLYCLDYLALGQADPDQIEQIVKGIADGCEEAGCALIGGETAEMPGIYDVDEYDIAGFVVGVAEKDELITGETIEDKDVLIGLPSNGIHSNGFSLVRKILENENLNLNTTYSPLTESLKDVLLTPTKIYVKSILALKEQVNLKGIAHITGGGFYENIPRMLPGDLGATIDVMTFPKPDIFSLIERYRDFPRRDMYDIFNMGIGMVVAVSQDEVEATLLALSSIGEEGYAIGEVNQTGEISLVGEESA
ncbi:phosphoribosylformylglycinamidine cyclo-ligase [Alkalibacillus flavidus]|uniref:Phosphoribosylformylglycinamidine cyclo-ligase n=1 Tax=Alkalibacillus flavidus TaxID=546021 RepID=A0ABV2KWM8_9BACI